MNVLVIDVGTSSMRGILLSQQGEIIAEHQEFYSVTCLENSQVEQDPADWENGLYQVMQQVASKLSSSDEKIDAISITSQRSSVIPVDQNIHPLCNAIMWQDKRTNYLCETLESCNDRVFELCGSRINPVFSGSKMTWIRQNQPELYEKVYKFMVIPDYLIYLLTGEICTDYTYGSRSLLMNIRTHQWDEELLEIFQVEKEKLCPLVEPGSICGTLTKKMAELTGCPEGIPVITAGGDQQCGAIGQGVVKQGALSITTGTGGFLISEIDHVPEDLRQDVICNFSSVKGEYVLESSVLTCCSAFDWFRKEFCQGQSFDEINERIQNTPAGSNGCICLPYFQGRSTPDWNNLAKCEFVNVTLGTTRNDMLRSLLEGICYEIRNGIDIMSEYLNIEEIYINGGLTNSEPFNEMQANVYGMKITRRGKADATARGALMVALTTLGACASVEEAFQMISQNCEVKVYVPKEETALQYENYRAQMNRIYRKMWGGEEHDGKFEFHI